MTKGHVFEVIKRNIVDTLDEVDDRQIRAHSTLRELGATSLDIVEVVSRSMRDLGVKVPRSELARAGDVGSLVELLYLAAIGSEDSLGHPTTVRGPGGGEPAGGS